MPCRKLASSASPVVLGSALGIAACAGPPEDAPAAAEAAAAEGGAAAALREAGAVEKLGETRWASKAPEGASAPSFVVEASWPKPLPNNWRIGQVGGIAVDSHDNIWVYHRPRTLGRELGRGYAESDDERAAVCRSARSDIRDRTPSKAPAAASRRRPCSSSTAKGTCSPRGADLPIRASSTRTAAKPTGVPGRPVSTESSWTKTTSSTCRATAKTTEPVSSRAWTAYPWAPSFGDDSHILKFSADGTFVYQIGNAGFDGPNSEKIDGGPNGTPQPYLVADMSVDPKTNRLYIADGYGNRRILIVDAATGQYIGHFGAYGQNPVVDDPSSGVADTDVGPWIADYQAGNMKPMFFRSPMHCATVSRDGFLYACDRGNNRVQIFDLGAADLGKPCANPSAEAGQVRLRA